MLLLQFALWALGLDGIVRYTMLLFDYLAVITEVHRQDIDSALSDVELPVATFTIRSMGCKP